MGNKKNKKNKHSKHSKHSKDKGKDNPPQRIITNTGKTPTEQLTTNAISLATHQCTSIYLRKGTVRTDRAASYLYCTEKGTSGTAGSSPFFLPTRHPPALPRPHHSSPRPSNTYSYAHPRPSLPSDFFNPSTLGVLTIRSIPTPPLLYIQLTQFKTSTMSPMRAHNHPPPTSDNFRPNNDTDATTQALYCPPPPVLDIIDSHQLLIRAQRTAPQDIQLFPSQPIQFLTDGGVRIYTNNAAGSGDQQQHQVLLSQQEPHPHRHTSLYANQDYVNFVGHGLPSFTQSHTHVPSHDIKMHGLSTADIHHRESIPQHQQQQQQQSSFLNMLYSEAAGPGATGTSADLVGTLSGVGIAGSNGGGNEWIVGEDAVIATEASWNAWQASNTTTNANNSPGNFHFENAFYETPHMPFTPLPTAGSYHQPHSHTQQQQQQQQQHYTHPTPSSYHSSDCASSSRSHSPPSKIPVRSEPQPHQQQQKPRAATTPVTNTQQQRTGKANGRRTACDQCRRRKHRCDGGRPQCVPCSISTAGRCTYDGEVLPGPANPQQQAQKGTGEGQQGSVMDKEREERERGERERELEERVRTLEKMLGDARRGMGGGGGEANGGNDGGANETSAGLDTAPPATKPRSQSQPTLGNPNAMDTALPINAPALAPDTLPLLRIHYSTFEEADQVIHNLHLHASSPASSSPPPATEKPDPTPSKVVEQFCREYKQRYANTGPTPDIYFVDDITRLTEEMRVDDDDEESTAATERSSPGAAGTGAGQGEVAVVLPEDINEPYVNMELLELHFKHATSLIPYPLLHRSTVLSRPSSLPPLTLYALYANICTLHPSPSIRALQNQFYTRARNLVVRSMENPSVGVLQGLHLLTIATLMRRSMRAAGVVGGLAVRMAGWLGVGREEEEEEGDEGVGANIMGAREGGGGGDEEGEGGGGWNEREDGDGGEWNGGEGVTVMGQGVRRGRKKKMGWVEIETRRRIWWALYISDILKSAIQNQPTFFERPHHYNVPLPCDDALWELSDTTGRLPLRYLHLKSESYCALGTSFMSVCARAVAYNRTALAQGVDLTRFDPVYAGLEAEVQHWYMRCPGTVWRAEGARRFTMNPFGDSDPQDGSSSTHDSPNANDDGEEVVPYHAVDLCLQRLATLCLLRRPRMVAAVGEGRGTREARECVEEAVRIARVFVGVTERLVGGGGAPDSGVGDATPSGESQPTSTTATQTRGPSDATASTETKHIHVPPVTLMTCLGIREAGFIHIMASCHALVSTPSITASTSTSPPPSSSPHSKESLAAFDQAQNDFKKVLRFLNAVTRRYPPILWITQQLMLVNERVVGGVKIGKGMLGNTTGPEP
ncbi:uncharacterized protein EV422DRAFT_603666 [Fimicolochytrium jonesii]|uniref:uncharacterized protein n=1 Tax=Fimicolochytrium jonesii TaxID=1396493 RepID=UPI0022FE5EE6|nr:uncharacterized protein EV422DRAFT_603666 [Fimicolochytrium jonesii]KAI8817859.1 hypothetical protein EV422DRAFT_603666 [Fimicolochytrium jonesii]